MKKIMMFYRAANPRIRENNPEHRLSKWNYMLVDDTNSEMSDGETYDLVQYYQENTDEFDQPMWEVHLVEVDLPE